MNDVELIRLNLRDEKADVWLKWQKLYAEVEFNTFQEHSLSNYLHFFVVNTSVLIL